MPSASGPAHQQRQTPTNRRHDREPGDAPYAAGGSIVGTDHQPPPRQRSAPDPTVVVHERSLVLLDRSIDERSKAIGRLDASCS